MPDKTAFILMPFADRYREVYDEVYHPVCEANGLKCWRVDEISRPGSITKDIVEGIFDADIIIADLTSRNPNVFYELGIAHATGNKTIMTAQSLEYVPFDIANYRVIIYEQSISGSKALRKNIESAIKELLKALDRTNNPVQEVAAGRYPGGRKTRVPLVKYMNMARLPWQARNYLQEKGIVFVDDLTRLDLEDFANRPGIGPESLRALVSPLLAFDLYEDGEKLHNFIMKYRISTQPQVYRR